MNRERHALPGGHYIETWTDHEGTLVAEWFRVNSERKVETYGAFVEGRHGSSEDVISKAVGSVMGWEAQA